MGHVLKSQAFLCICLGFSPLDLDGFNSDYENYFYDFKIDENWFLMF